MVEINPSGPPQRLQNATPGTLSVWHVGQIMLSPGMGSSEIESSGEVVPGSPLPGSTRGCVGAGAGTTNSDGRTRGTVWRRRHFPGHNIRIAS